MERLRGLDSAFLYLETPTNHLHMAWAAVLDTRAAPDAASVGALSGLVRERLTRLPALRKRLADPRLGYTQPDWIDVDVDPVEHCTVHTSADLEAVAADVLSTPLDRRRPLWELHIVEGLPGARTGMIMKVHHALLDGPSGAELMVQLLDLERRPRPARTPTPTTPLRVDAQPSRAELQRLALRRAGRGAERAAAELRNAISVLAATRRWDTEHPDAATTGNFAAPPTPFNQPITARRSVRFTAMSLDDVDRVRHGTQSTVNDVVLAITGGALRRYLGHRHALPTASLLALVPVSARDPMSKSGGNQTSAFITTLSTDTADPLERLAEVSRVTQAMKARHDQTATGSLVGLLDIVPPRTGQQLARLAGRLRVTAVGRRSFNVVVSNVHGPDTPFYCNGALVETAHPIGPITDGSALNVTVVSYRRNLAFGLVGCPDVITDLDRLRDEFDAEIDAMRTTATTT